MVSLLDALHHSSNPLTHHSAGRIFAAMINGNDKQRFFIDVYMYDTWFPEEFSMPWDLCIGCHQEHSNMTVTPSEINHRRTICEALQNPKSERFYQQLEPTTKQNHTETRSVARVGVKLVELDTKQPKHTRVTTSALKRLFTPQTGNCLVLFVTTFRQPFKCQLETKNMHNVHAVSLLDMTSTEFLNSHQNICHNAQAIFSKHSHAQASV